jgi:hypothetical protein
MTQRIEPADAATRARIKKLHETPMSPAEFRALVDMPVTEDERENSLALIEWFMRRYPTPTDRLIYARRAYRRSTAGNE